MSDFSKPDRIVLGCSDHDAAEAVAELHEPLGAPIIITDLRTAEMIKYASNAFLATRISFINEIAQICEKLGTLMSKRLRAAWVPTDGSGRTFSMRALAMVAHASPRTC